MLPLAFVTLVTTSEKMKNARLAPDGTELGAQLDAVVQSEVVPTPGLGGDASRRQANEGKQGRAPALHGHRSDGAHRGSRQPFGTMVS